MKISLDQTYEVLFSFSQEDVEAFAKVSGDHNPLHLDEEFAAHTTFKRPIMHGMLAASVFSRVLGMEFPGKGSIYLGQSLEFLRPMYVDTEYKATFKVLEINEKKHTAKIETHVYTTDRNKITLRGEASMMNAELIG
ncbi:MAG: MaoC family dehydratase [Bacteroidota bacterium]